jgi:hypothetical protein
MVEGLIVQKVRQITQAQWRDLMTCLLLMEFDVIEKLHKSVSECYSRHDHNNAVSSNSARLIAEKIGDLDLSDRERLAIKIYSMAQVCAEFSDNGVIHFCNNAKVDLQQIYESDYFDALLLVDMYCTQNLPTQVRLWHQDSLNIFSKAAAKSGEIILSNNSSFLRLNKLAGGWTLENCNFVSEKNKIQSEGLLAEFNAMYIAARFSDTFRVMDFIGEHVIDGNM